MKILKIIEYGKERKFEITEEAYNQIAQAIINAWNKKQDTVKINGKEIKMKNIRLLNVTPHKGIENLRLNLQSKGIIRKLTK